MLDKSACLCYIVSAMNENPDILDASKEELDRLIAASTKTKFDLPIVEYAGRKYIIATSEKEVKDAMEIELEIDETLWDLPVETIAAITGATIKQAEELQRKGDSDAIRARGCALKGWRGFVEAVCNECGEAIFLSDSDGWGYRHNCGYSIFHINDEEIFDL